MGTDAIAYAKLKDGTYRRRAMDRLYVFNTNEFDHPPIYPGNKEADFFAAEQYHFSIEHGLAWCKRRIELLSNATIRELQAEGIKGGYYLRWTAALQHFMEEVQMLGIEVEFIALYADSDNFDFDLYTQNATIIDI